jgi:hypothetical protein
MGNISLKCFICLYFLSPLNHDCKLLEEREKLLSDVVCPLILHNRAIRFNIGNSGNFKFLKNNKHILACSMKYLEHNYTENIIYLKFNLARSYLLNQIVLCSKHLEKTQHSDFCH